MARGLLFSPDERPTFTALNLLQALEVCFPVPDASDEISALIMEVVLGIPPGHLPGDPSSLASLTWLADQAATQRPAAEQSAWTKLAAHLRGRTTP